MNTFLMGASMKSLYKQRGIGLIQLTLYLVVAGFLANFGVKVIPMYADNRYIVAALKTLVEGGNNLSQMSDTEIRRKMDAFYIVNNVRNQDPKDLKIDRKADRVVVTLDYEMRENLFLNADVVVHFVNQLDSTRPALCCSPIVEAKSAAPNL
jgi:hypothetical protein